MNKSNNKTFCAFYTHLFLPQYKIGGNGTKWHKDNMKAALCGFKRRYEDIMWYKTIELSTTQNIVYSCRVFC